MITLKAGGRQFSLARARLDDVAGIVALLRDDPLGTNREADDLGSYERAFAAVDADPAQFLAVVSPIGHPGEVCATMQLTLIPGLSRRGATRLQIEAVRVGDTARGLGLGTAMVEWAHRYGRDHGAALVQLTTDKRRTDAHRFYARLGYEASHEGMKLAL